MISQASAGVLGGASSQEAWLMRQGFRPFCLTMRRTGLVFSAKSQRVAPASPEWVLRESSVRD
jgi:hypothetical protein